MKCKSCRDLGVMVVRVKCTTSPVHAGENTLARQPADLHFCSSCGGWPGLRVTARILQELVRHDDLTMSEAMRIASDRGLEFPSRPV